MRRSRLRGTDFLVIKFAPTFLIGQNMDEHEDVSNQLKISTRDSSLSVLTSSLNDLLSCNNHPHHHNQMQLNSFLPTSMHSPSLLLSSIASRVKWGSLNIELGSKSTDYSDRYVINADEEEDVDLDQEIDDSSNENKLISTFEVCENSPIESFIDRETILQPRTRLPPKRLNMVDHDLQLALQRVCKCIIYF